MGSSHQSERSLFPLPEMIIAVLAPLAGLFSSAVWEHAQVLVIGAILCQDPHTVAAARRVMGLGQEPRFERYHRVLKRVRWSGLQAAKSWLGLVGNHRDFDRCFSRR
jgi:hypothetical protein